MDSQIPAIDTDKLFLPSFEHKIDRKLFMDIYTEIYNACTKNSQHGKYVYDALTKFLELKMHQVQKQWHHNPPTPILVQYLEFFNNYKLSAKFYHHTMDYLNRHWIKRELDEGKQVYDINTTCLILFKLHLFESVKSDLLVEVQLLLHQHRQVNITAISHQIDSSAPPPGTVNNTALLQSQLNDLVSSILLFCLNDQNYYHEQFITPFKEWYSQYAIYYDSLFTTVTTQSLLIYMSHAQFVLKYEYQLLTNCFNHLFIDELKGQLHELIIVKYKSHIISHLLPFLMELNKTGLSLAYALLDTIQCKQPLHDVVYTFIYEHLKDNPFVEPVGSTGSLNEGNLVFHYISIYNHFIDLMQCFSNDPGCIASLDRAFTDHLNTIPNIPELLAKQADQSLRKVQSDYDLLQLNLRNVLTLFKYVQDKDIFHKVYSKGLCKRLLFNASMVEMEQWMVSQLKELCGYEYTSKLQRLYSDISTSKGLFLELRNLDPVLNKIQFDVDLSVVSTATWPLVVPKESINLPSTLEEAISSINVAYQNKHVGRKLNFMHSHGRCELKYTPGKMTYLLTCSTFQSAALLLFKGPGDQFTVDELVLKLGLGKDILIQHLGILFRAKILQGISVPTDQLSDALANCTGETIITLNGEFNSKKLKMNLFQFLKSNVVDVDEVINMDQDRQLVIQACIVRIMKSRKSLKYVVLMNEVIQQLTNKFKPKIGMIKKCIDVLIEKEYLKRDEEDTNTLVYLA